MNDDGKPGSWEEQLDDQLRGLVDVAEFDPGRLLVGRGSPATGNADGSEDENAWAISVDRLRMEIAHSLQAGMSLAKDIYDESGVLLLAAGSRITPRFLQLLRERGVRRVRLGAQGIRGNVAARPERAVDAREKHTPSSRELDEHMAVELQKPVLIKPVKLWRRPRLVLDRFREETSRGVIQHAATGAAVSDLCGTLQAGRKASVDELRGAFDHFVDMAALDFDLLPLIMSMQESNDEYLYDHCVNVALVSMAIASQLGLERDAVMEIGLGGLLQDIGMLRVPLSIRLARRSLSTEEWRVIHHHPLHTLDMLTGLRGVPQSVKFIAYQVHERQDGSGYPRGREGRHIHKYAEIVSLADVYSAMTRERPHRPHVSPYQAAKRILADVGEEKFDRELVRALLDTLSLFPIGSRVSLSNGAKARVLRANPGLHTCPVVEELTADGCPTGHIIDLSQEATPTVVTAE